MYPERANARAGGRGAKPTISKSVFLNALACPTLGWWSRSFDAPDELSPVSLTASERFLLEEGADIGRRASLLFPEGILVGAKDPTIAAAETAALMADAQVSVIFEATFLVAPYVARADILVRAQKRWRLIEVKSGLASRREYVDDVAYTVMVLRAAGVELWQASLLLVSKDFRLGNDDADLFEEVDCSEAAVMLAIARKRRRWSRVAEQTSSATIPTPSLIKLCKKCPVFKQCLGKDIENHVLEMPNLHAASLERLVALGVARIEDIPPDFKLSARQSKIREAVIDQTPWVSDSLQKELRRIVWPAFYLDFETVLTAVPLYDDVAPYEQIPTQYSIHKCPEVGRIGTAKHFLADPPNQDRRRQLAESLIADLEQEGTILTYTAFERRVLNRLKELFPDLVNPLDKAIGRMVDLELIISRHYYHPDFHGSYSIKDTLPALVPDLSYDDLAIKEGGTAIAVFARLARGVHTNSEAARIKANLLDYCARDTFAMVKLHERLQEYCGPGQT